MTVTFDDSYFDALTRLAYDPPPIAHPGLTVSVIRFAAPGAFPDISIEDQQYPVIGVTATGWLSTARLGWCQYIGDPAALPQIAKACNAAQRELIKEGDRLMAALARYVARANGPAVTTPRHTHAGGQP
ncbi:MAG: hypothetical protein RQ750_06200 [Roseovarius sp.]|nr:hypothetical protein [Roseovarius sp.]